MFISEEMKWFGIESWNDDLLIDDFERMKEEERKVNEWMKEERKGGKKKRKVRKIKIVEIESVEEPIIEQ